MTTAEQLKRLQDFAEAVESVEQMPHYKVTESIKRTLKLLELCPWIVGEKAKAAGGAKKKGAAK